MVKLRLPYNTRFIDRQHNKTYHGPGDFEVPDDAEEHYLTRRWQTIDEESNDEPIVPTEDLNEPVDAPEEDPVDEPTEQVENHEDEPWKDKTRQELEEMSYEKLRTMASKANRDDVDGRSKKQDIIDAFASGEEEEQ